ncbi:Frizzled [Balamuthia mandrillaris]
MNGQRVYCRWYLLWLAVATVSLAGTLVCGQTCQQWNGVPSYCAQFEEWQGPDVHIYVPENYTLETLQQSVSFAVNLVGAIGDDGSIASRCNRMWVRLNCGSYLRPCASVKDSASACTEYVESTGLPVGGFLYYPPGFAAPLTCTEVDTDGQPFYQSSNYSALFNNKSYPLQCNRLMENGTRLVCEPPLTAAEDSNSCGFECPLPSYTEGQYESIKRLQLVLSWLSWAGSLVVILSYTLHNKLRKFPSNLILMAAVAAHAESVGMILPTFFGYHNTWCGFDTVYLMPESGIENQDFAVYFQLEHLAVHSPLCTFQGWLVQMGFLSSTMWWGIVAFNMFLSVYFGKKLPNTKTWNNGLQIVLHVCGWAVPCFLMLVPAAADEIAFAPGATFCSLDSADVYFLVFWAIPIGIILLVGTALFLASLVQLFQFARQLKELKKTCGTYFRVILFILIYLVLITFIFAYSLRVLTARDTIEDGYSEYYRCLVLLQPDCSLSEEVHNFGLAVLRSIGYSSLGLLLFLNFCISPSMGRFWWRFFNKVRQGRFSSMFTSEKTPGTGGKTGGEKSKKSKSTTRTHDMITMSMDDEADGEAEVIP